MMLENMLEAARAIVLEEGQRLAARMADLGHAVATSEFDIKVAADAETEGRLAARLIAETNLPAFGEERGWYGAKADTFWIIDPLDGSANYNRGIRLSAISIALSRGTLPIIGLIYDIHSGECFIGGEGIPATLNRAAVRVSEANNQHGAILATGIPAAFATQQHRMSDFGLFLADWRKVRMFGSAAIAMAYVATGRVDAYFETGIRYWDVAAGIALVRAGGGTVRLAGDSLDGTWNVAAAPSGFHWPRTLEALWQHRES